MKSLVGQPVFRVGEVQYFWEDAVLSAVARGGWAEFEHQLHTEVACARWQQATGTSLPHNEVDAAAAEFRYARSLIAAVEMYAWLEQWGLSVGEWMAYVRRTVARQSAGHEVERVISEHAPSADELSAARAPTFLCSGAAKRFVEQLAMRASAAERVGPVSPSDADVAAPLARIQAGGMPSGFGELDAERLCERSRIVAALEVAYARFRAAVLTPQALRHEIDGRHLDWIRVDYRTATFPVESVAREAILCVREDGEDLGSVAREAGVSIRRSGHYLSDVDRTLRERLLGARAGELLGPVEEDGGFRIYHVEAKQLPSLDDADVRRQAEDSALQRALAGAVNDCVQWLVTL